MSIYAETVYFVKCDKCPRRLRGDYEDELGAVHAARDDGWEIGDEWTCDASGAVWPIERHVRCPRCISGETGDRDKKGELSDANA